MKKSFAGIPRRIIADHGPQLSRAYLAGLSMDELLRLDSERPLSPRQPSTIGKVEFELRRRLNTEV